MNGAIVALLPGEILAVMSAVFYSLASVAIVRAHRPKDQAKDSAKDGVTDRDNGVFLSVLVTAVMSGIIWLSFGHAGVEQFNTSAGRSGGIVFALAGVFSIILGRSYLYRATELLGAVRASLIRRLTPIFAVVFAFVLLGTLPEWRDVFGGTIVLIGVLLYFGPLRHVSTALPRGYLVAIASAAFYALAYCLRSLGLDDIPDPALGTFIGAMTGLVWLWARAWFHHDWRTALLRYLWHRGRWHWVAALSLSIGQTLQFFALNTASVPVVAVLGTLEVIFAAALAAVMGLGDQQSIVRLCLCVGLALAGTALLVG